MGLENVKFIKTIFRLEYYLSISLSFSHFPHKVVSEVLFPSADSPVEPRSLRSSISSIHTSPAPSQSLAPPPQHLSQPHEVIGQLMQEAEGKKVAIVNPRLVT